MINGAIYDIACLKGSSIANKEIIAESLFHALAWFCPSDHAYELLASSAQPHRPYTNTQHFRDMYDDRVSTQCATHEKTIARAVLRSVRYDINTFRDERWDGLVRARNRLMRTVLAFEVAMLLLIALAIANLGLPSQAWVR